MAGWSAPFVQISANDFRTHWQLVHAGVGRLQFCHTRVQFLHHACLHFCSDEHTRLQARLFGDSGILRQVSDQQNGITQALLRHHQRSLKDAARHISMGMGYRAPHRRASGD